MERDVSPRAAEALVREGARLVDVREADELVADGRIPGAEHVPLGTLAERAGDLAGETVVFVCRSGARSGMAADALRASGFEAYNVDGGILAWERDGLPVERDAPPVERDAPPPARDAPSPNRNT
ncbi:MAG TPA: rhodanese-like domain-containing protein [Solirubrobacteraceae bacterium]|nr:rhodanese-like domain-containing protein [Solirubrobacteraceae bacterium]